MVAYPLMGVAGGLVAVTIRYLPGRGGHSPADGFQAGAGMGIGALTCAMVNLRLTSVLLTSLFLASDGPALMPLVIMAVVVTYVARARLPFLAGPDAATSSSATTSPPPTHTEPVQAT